MAPVRLDFLLESGRFESTMMIREILPPTCGRFKRSNRLANNQSKLHLTSLFLSNKRKV